MTSVKGGYAYPSATTRISDSWNGHRNRPRPSTEPGTDYPTAYGSRINAPEDGRVVDVQSHPGGGTGRFVTIDLDDGRRTRALHLSRTSVSPGQRVVRGQEIGKSGASGFGKDWYYGPHVHQTLWERQAYSFGRNATMDFQSQVGADNDGGGTPYSQTVANEQNFLNTAQGEKLVVDGLAGPAYRAAVKRYQEYLKKRNWYSGKIDGIWGSGTQKGHGHRYAEWAGGQTPANPQYHNVSLNDIAELSDVRGLQKIASLYLRQSIDNKWGPSSKTGFQRFLNQNYGGSITAWLRRKWGYVGNEQWGPVMKAALERANAANLREL